MVNYVAAFICGMVLYDGIIDTSKILKSSWFYAAIGLGFLFIAIFEVMAKTAQNNGLSVASVASKMSVIIPIIFGILVFKESIGAPKIIGILLALIAVYLTSVKQKENVVLTKSIYLPIVLFFGSGIIDTSINYFAPDDKIHLFSSIIFVLAALIGFLILGYKSLVEKSRFKIKSVPFGIALGIVNYGSIYFLLKALRVNGYESSSIFTIINVAIIALSTLMGLLIFKEKISKKNTIGIGLAIISIILITLY